jgi:hypothetical protein
MATARERMDIRVQAPMGDHGAVRTALTIQKWDADATAWAADRIGVAKLLAVPGANVTITPGIFRELGIQPYETWHMDDANMVVQAGWVALLGGVAGTTMSPKFDATHGRIGVGTSSTAASYTQTTLVGDTGSGSTTSYFKLVSGAPTITTASTPPTLVFAATFGTAVGNFSWQEFGTDAGTADSVSNATTGGTFFNRGVQNMGTKVAGQTWSATETITFGYPSGAGTVT